MKVSIDVPDRTLPYEYGQSFCGQTMGCNYQAFENISDALLAHPVNAIVEFGTYHGALSVYLGLWGLRLGVPVYTYDIVDLRGGVEDLLDRLGVSFRQEDVFSESARHTVQLLCERGPIYLLCDGGDKWREFNEYFSLLPVGSLISIHDWGTEVKQDIEAPVMFVNKQDWEKHDARFATVLKIGDA